MTTDVSHGDVRDLLGAYALDAVDRAEATLVTEHLAECSRCLGELDVLREIASAIGTMVESVPPALWDRIAGHMDDSLRISDPAVDFQVAPNGGPGTRSARSGRRVDPTATVRGRGARRAWGPVRGVWLVPWTLGIAAAVLIALLLVGLSSANGRVDRLNEALASQSARAAVNAALESPGHQLIDLRSVEGTRTAELVLLPSGNGYLVSSTMPALPDDETYQLWGLIDEQPISLGLLGSHPSQAAFTVAAASPSRFMVTIEPAGGVTTPDRASVAQGVVVQT